MTDINRLIASLKRRSAHAKEFGHDVLFVKLEDLDALVDALEKAQQENTAGVAGVVESYETTISMLKSRIAELESRTVKLPKLKMLEDYLAEVAIEERKQILVGVKLEFHRACVAAGIKVEAE